MKEQCLATRSRSTTMLFTGSSGCKYDNLTISPQIMNIYGSNVIFCGDNSPPNYRTFKTFEIVLRTDATLSRRGFRLSYQEEHCGGDITTESEIETVARDLKYVNLLGSYPTSHLYCIWNITAPPRKIIVLKY